MEEDEETTDIEYIRKGMAELPVRIRFAPSLHNIVLTHAELGMGVRSDP